MGGGDLRSRLNDLVQHQIVVEDAALLELVRLEAASSSQNPESNSLGIGILAQEAVGTAASALSKSGGP